MSHSIYLRKDGRWEARLSLGTDEHGKRRTRSFYGKSREEAEYKLLVSQQNLADEYAVTEMTVKELAIEFLHTSTVRLKESTAANYRMKAEKHIIPAFGDIQCCMLKSKMIYQFVEQKLKSGLSARYIADILVLMKSMFRYASREYHIRNVMDGIILPKCQKSETAIFSVEQQEILKSYITANQNLTTLGTALSLYTGVRIGELCALQWADIDLKKRILTVRKTIQRIQCPSGKRRTKLVITAPKSHSSCREIPIPECLCAMLAQFQADQNIYLLSGKAKPVEPRTMQYRFSKVLNNANLPSIHYHALRHAFATNCVTLGFDVKTLSEILGHSSIELTLNRYVHSSMERKQSCMNLLSWSAA
ncbi:MAG: site-specific integrase [Oscillospiraceae bacterium]|nr:site-specific integrase [Oscillospiraceae bacterium]